MLSKAWGYVADAEKKSTEGVKVLFLYKQRQLY